MKNLKRKKKKKDSQKTFGKMNEIKLLTSCIATKTRWNKILIFP